MRTTRLIILLMATTLLMLPVVATAGHKNSGYNNWPDKYARTAMKQVEKAYQRGCGFHGARWNSNYNNHRRFAAQNPVRAGEREIRIRDDMLRNCRRHDRGHGQYGGSYGNNYGYNGAGYDSQAAFADYYASTAVKQARANIRRGCGYYGERWTTDYNRHYRYGHKTRRYRAESEIQVRDRMLRECGRGGRGGRRH